MHCPCTTSNLNLWEDVLVQSGIEESIYEECRPNSSIEGQDVYEFDISGAGEDYADLSNSFLFVEFQVLKPAGGNLTEGTDKVGIINNALHSLFSQVDCWLNETLITRNSNLYSYKSYFEDLLSHGVEAQKSYLTAQGFFKQDASKFEAADDPSFVTRFGKTVTGKKYQVMGRLHLDICQQNKAILNNVNIKIKLIKNKNSFALFNGTSGDNAEHKIKITDMAFYIRKIRLSDDVKLAHMKQLEKEPARYHYKRVEMKSFTIPQNVSDINLEKVCDGKIPNKLFYGLVSNEAFNGDYHKNPYKFDNKGVNFVALYIDGKQVPANPFTPDYSNNKYVRPFYSLVEACGTLNSPFGNNLTYEDYKSSNNIYGHDLTPHLSEGNIATRQKGNVRVNLKTSSQLSASQTVITYSEFDDTLLIDKDRSILPFLE